MAVLKGSVMEVTCLPHFIKTKNAPTTFSKMVMVFMEERTFYTSNWGVREGLEPLAITRE